MGAGRLGREAEAAKFEAEKAEARKRNKKRHAAQLRANRQKGADGQFVSTKSRAEKLNIALKQLLDRLITESRRGFIEDVDWRDAESVKRRKAQFTNLKDLISIVRTMRDLITEVRDDEAKDDDTEKLVTANITLIEDARKQLEQVGIDADI